MNRGILLLFSLLFVSNFLIGQDFSFNKRIAISKTGNYIQYGRYIKDKELINQLETKPKCQKYATRARLGRAGMILISSASAYMVLIPIGQMALDHKPNWAYPLLGVGLFALNIPLYKSYKKNLKKGVLKFNRELPEEVLKDQRTNLEISLQSKYNGIAMVFKF